MYCNLKKNMHYLQCRYFWKLQHSTCTFLSSSSAELAPPWKKIFCQAYAHLIGKRQVVKQRASVGKTLKPHWMVANRFACRSLMKFTPSVKNCISKSGFNNFCCKNVFNLESQHTREEHNKHRPNLPRQCSSGVTGLCKAIPFCHSLRMFRGEEEEEEDGGR